VRSVALAAQPPFSVDIDGDSRVQITAEEPSATSRVQANIIEETVGAGYFAALNEPVVAGREFTDMDDRIQPEPSKALPVLVNESAAHALFQNGNAIGQHLHDDKQSYEVVGVVPEIRDGSGIKWSLVYLPITARNFARPPADGISIMVRSDSGSDTLAAIRREVAGMDPALNFFNVRTLKGYLDESRAYERFSVDTYGGMGVFGLVLAAIGLAGVTAYAVAQRRKEIGIRIALGARKFQVLGLLLREGTVLVSLGSILGFLGALILAKALSAMTNIFVDALNVGTNDARLLLGAPLLLAGLAMFACYIPARRAMKIDPLNALRRE
jgi:ABC-type antimicrobial peptide transport system permease subunit